jgi:hypothetical protein
MEVEEAKCYQDAKEFEKNKTFDVRKEKTITHLIIKVINYF